VEFVAVHEPIKPIMPLERPVDVGPFNDIALQGLRDRVKPFVEIAQKKVRSLDRYQKPVLIAFVQEFHDFRLSDGRTAVESRAIPRWSARVVVGVALAERRRIPFSP